MRVPADVRLLNVKRAFAVAGRDYFSRPNPAIPQNGPERAASDNDLITDIIRTRYFASQNKARVLNC
jgi:hypothetical protein